MESSTSTKEEMTMSWTNKDIKEAMEAISKKAMTDAAFRKTCLEDSGKAIEEATGKTLPESFKVRFIENEGADATFVLPDFQPTDIELMESDLDQVAGGVQNKCGATCGGSEVSSAMYICG